MRISGMRQLMMALTLFTADPMAACDCKPMMNVKESTRSADLVISGTVLNAELGKRLEQTGEYLDGLSRSDHRLYVSSALVNEYVVLVNTAFKGASVGDTVVIRTALDPVTDCGLRLSPGDAYIFYSNTIAEGDKYFDREAPGLYTTSACTRTRPYSRQEARALRKQVAQ